MADIGINFRNTSGYVTDGADETYSLGEVYPVTRGGYTFGWSVDRTGTSLDRSSSVDRRLAGMVYSGDPSHYFRLDLSATGNYDVRVAAGDSISNANPVDWDFKDNTTTLFSTSGTPPASGDFKDATDTTRTTAAWPGSNVAQSVTFSTTQLRAYVAGASGNRVIAHIRAVSAATPGPPDSRARIFRSEDPRFLFDE